MELSRKRFLAKLLGLAALGGIASRRIVALASDRIDRTAGQPGRPWALRPEPRAVSRRADNQSNGVETQSAQRLGSRAQRNASASVTSFELRALCDEIGLKDLG